MTQQDLTLSRLAGKFYVLQVIWPRALPRHLIPDPCTYEITVYYIRQWPTLLEREVEAPLYSPHVRWPFQHQTFEGLIQLNLADTKQASILTSFSGLTVSFSPQISLFCHPALAIVSCLSQSNFNNLKTSPASLPITGTWPASKVAAWKTIKNIYLLEGRP